MCFAKSAILAIEVKCPGALVTKQEAHAIKNIAVAKRYPADRLLLRGARSSEMAAWPCKTRDSVTRPIPSCRAAFLKKSLNSLMAKTLDHDGSLPKK